MARKTVIIDKLDQAPGESIEHYYRRLAKQADQRLVRLEAAAHEEGYRKIKNWAYRKAMDDIKHWSGEGSIRFNTKPPMTYQENEEKINYQSLRAKIKDIRQFLEAPTSTKSGVTKTYKKRTDSINKSQGTNFTWDQLAKVFEPSGGGTSYESLHSQGYGSDEILRVFSAIKNGEVKIKDGAEAIEDKKLKELLESVDWDNIIEVEDELVGESIVKMLKAGDIKPEEVFGEDWKEKILKLNR